MRVGGPPLRPARDRVRRGESMRSAPRSWWSALPLVVALAGCAGNTEVPIGEDDVLGVGDDATPVDDTGPPPSPARRVRPAAAPSASTSPATASTAAPARPRA